VLLPAAALAVFATVLGASSKIDWLATPQHAFVVLPPSLITDGSVERAVWSPNGAYLLVASIPNAPLTIDQILNYTPTQGAPPLPVMSGGPVILTWDRARQQVRKIWSTDDPNVKFAGVEWLTGSSTAYVTMMGATTSNGLTTLFCGVLAIDAETGHFSWVPGMDHLPQFPNIIPSPTQPTAVAVFNDQPVPPLPGYVVGGGGGVQVAQATAVAAAPVALGSPTKVPEGEYIAEGANNYWTLAPGGRVVRRTQSAPNPNFGLVWGKDGSKWYLAERNRNSKAVSVQAMDDNGKLTPVTVELYIAPAERREEVVLQAKPMVAKQRKVRRGFNNLWLSSPTLTFHPDVLITPNGVQAQLSPTADAVFYVDGGIAKVRALVALSDDQKKGLYDALKHEALSNAKQAGLGLLMYSNDYDGVLPPAGTFDIVDPYLKNQDVMDDFMYTPPGDLGTTNMQNPASTILGYIDGPDGRAIVYGDGHVIWSSGP
jgi:hypothetical protein